MQSETSSSREFLTTQEMKQSWPEMFGTSRVLPHKLFLTVRVILAVLFVGILVADLWRHFYGGYYLIYLTRWSFILETLYLCLAMYVTYKSQAILAEGASHQSLDQMPYVVRATHLLWLLTMPIVVAICLSYWSLLNPVWGLTSPPDFLSVFEHGLNMVFFLFEFYINRNTYSLKPAVVVIFIYCSLYSMFTVIHFVARIGVSPHDACTNYERRECPIYHVLDFHHPIKALALEMIMILMVQLLAVVLWFVGRARDRADAKKMMSSSTVDAGLEAGG